MQYSSMVECLVAALKELAEQDKLEETVEILEKSKRTRKDETGTCMCCFSSTLYLSRRALFT